VKKAKLIEWVDVYSALPKGLISNPTKEANRRICHSGLFVAQWDEGDQKVCRFFSKKTQEESLVNF
jgi:hypothetical protein